MWTEKRGEMAPLELPLPQTDHGYTNCWVYNFAAQKS